MDGPICDPLGSSAMAVLHIATHEVVAISYRFLFVCTYVSQWPARLKKQAHAQAEAWRTLGRGREASGKPRTSARASISRTRVRPKRLHPPTLHAALHYSALSTQTLTTNVELRPKRAPLDLFAAELYFDAPPTVTLAAHTLPSGAKASASRARDGRNR